MKPDGALATFGIVTLYQATLGTCKGVSPLTPALVRSRRRSRPSGHRRKRRMRGLAPSEPPLNLPAIRHTAHGTIRGAVVVAPLTPFHVCQIHSRLGQGKGRWELALTSTLFPVWSCRLTAASIPQSANEGYAPVVADCSIDPSTQTERTSFALRLRLRRRSRRAAPPSACADTRAPSVVNASRAY